MSWPEAAMVVAALASIVGGLHVSLPYLRKKSDAEARLAALEAANVRLLERTARLEQWAHAGGPLGTLRNLGVMSR